jgi:thymidylate synthase
MYVIQARNVNDAYAQALRYLYVEGIEESSRNGPVLVAPGPVTTVYSHPCERVLFSSKRDANPFFHFFEALWMLAGRNDLDFPQQFNKRFGEYSDDGVTLAGAYGYRWREYFGYDQLQVIADELKHNPHSRRCVLSMWDAQGLGYDALPDLLRQDSKDLPCNTTAYFDVRSGRLNMTVCCRSNDIVWGAYGANAVHFSMLLEYMAAAVGVPVGVYRQMSNNFHLYTDVVPKAKMLELAEDAVPAYPEVTPMVAIDPSTWLQNIGYFVAGEKTLVEPFLAYTVVPMWYAWQAHKAGDYAAARATCGTIRAVDWRVACTAWLQRRQAKQAAKAV